MPRPLRVAYDVGPLLDPPTGVGRYTRELGAALGSTGAELRRYAVAFGGDVRAAGSDVARWRVPARLMRAAWRRFRWPPIERLIGDVDVVHATNFVLPVLRDTPGVVTVHDLAFLRDDVFPGGEALRDLVPWSVARAARVLVPTESVKDELVDRLRADAQDVVVTPEGVSPLFFGATPLGDTVLAQLEIPGPFVLALGTIEPRKNLPRLLEAWSLIRGDVPGWSLVLAGARGWGPRLPETPGVVLPGWVGDETLPGLMAAAEIFCYPSLYEGFGLPPLEAMAAGTPVIAGRSGATAEVLGDAAVLVDPLDAAALGEALGALVTGERRRRSLVLQGRARAADYTWEGTARATLEAYREAAGI